MGLVGSLLSLRVFGRVHDEEIGWGGMCYLVWDAPEPEPSRPSHPEVSQHDEVGAADLRHIEEDLGRVTLPHHRCGLHSFVSSDLAGVVKDRRSLLLRDPAGAVGRHDHELRGASLGQRDGLAQSDRGRLRAVRADEDGPIPHGSLPQNGLNIMSHRITNSPPKPMTASTKGIGERRIEMNWSLVTASEPDASASATRRTRL